MPAGEGSVGCVLGGAVVGKGGLEAPRENERGRGGEGERAEEMQIERKRVGEEEIQRVKGRETEKEEKKIMRGR